MAKKSILNFTITGIFFWILLVLSTILGENVDFFNSVYNTKLSFNSIAICSVLFLTVFVILLYFEIKHSSVKVNIPILIFITIFFSLGIIGIWRVEDTTVNYSSFTTIVMFSLLEKLGWTFIAVIGAITCYLFLALYPRKSIKNSALLIPLYIFVFVAFSAVIYSLITENNMYGFIFTDPTKEIIIKSYTNNENAYGAFLMYAIFALGIISSKWNKWFNYVLMLLLFVALVFSTSLTSIFVSFVFLIIFLIYQFSITMKHHPIKNAIYLGCFIIFITLFIIIFNVMVKQDIGFIQNFNSFLNSYILKKDFHTFSGRYLVWKEGLSFLKGLDDILLGLGFKSFDKIFTYYQQLKYPSSVVFGSVDSSYVQIICSYGVIGLITYFGLICYIFYTLVYLLIKKQYKIALPTLLVLSLLLFYGYFEKSVFFEPGIKGGLLTTLFISPALTTFYKTKNKQIDEEIKNYEIKIPSFQQKENLVGYKIFSSIILGLIVVFTSSLIFNPFHNKSILFIALLIIAFLVILFINLPFLSILLLKGDISKHNIKKRIILTFILSLILILGFTIPFGIKLGLVAAFLGLNIITFIILFILNAVFSFLYSNFDHYMVLLFKESILTNLIPVLIYSLIVIPVNSILNTLPIESFNTMSMFFVIITELFFFFFINIFGPNYKSARNNNILFFKYINDLRISFIRYDDFKEKQRHRNMVQKKPF